MNQLILLVHFENKFSDLSDEIIFKIESLNSGN